MFYQTLMLIIYDHGSKMYVPVYWVLMTNKTEKSYSMVFSSIIEDLGCEFKPATVGIDFEKAFIKAVGKAFPDADLIGCLFHFKQAIRRYMKQKLYLADWICSIAMRKGMIDLLCVLPIEDLVKKGIPYVITRLVKALEDTNRQFPVDKITRLHRYIEK